MSEAASENMVLRTVYLPRAMDHRLRDLAFKLALTKGELMRVLVQESLDRRADNTSRSDVTVAQREAAKLRTKPVKKAPKPEPVSARAAKEAATAATKAAGALATAAAAAATKALTKSLVKKSIAKGAAAKVRAAAKAEKAPPEAPAPKAAAPKTSRREKDLMDAQPAKRTGTDG